MNPDWDGVMKARAREPKPPKTSWTIRATDSELRKVLANLVKETEHLFGRDTRSDEELKRLGIADQRAWNRAKAVLGETRGE